MQEIILTFGEAGQKMRRCKHWVRYQGKIGNLDFARIPGSSRNYGVTGASVERLMKQAAKAGGRKAARHA